MSGIAARQRTDGWWVGSTAGADRMRTLASATTCTSIEAIRALLEARVKIWRIGTRCWLHSNVCGQSMGSMSRGAGHSRVRYPRSYSSGSTREPRRMQHNLLRKGLLGAE